MYDFKNYNPKQAAMDETRSLLTLGVKNAMANGSLPEKEMPDFVVEIPNDNKNGDIASNIAMAGARVFGMAPRKIADAIVAALPSLQDSMFEKVEIAGPGFLNLFFSDAWFAGVVLAANLNGDAYGRTDFGAGKKVNVEFVSANPTGPMHLGNARGGALGDGLAAALDWAGYDVTREFLINDAGNQIVKFGKSLATRYLQIYKGEDAVPFPEDGYQGEDIKVLAQSFADDHGDKFVNGDFEVLQNAIIHDALPKNIEGLKNDLAKYRITYDVWFSETTLHESGAIQNVLDVLAARGATYEKDGAVWYRSTQYS
ncbi:MAG: arginine--tRNA ligase, partial [Ruthenibacterium sp.]